MNTTKPFCKQPIVLREWHYNIVKTLEGMGFRPLFFVGPDNLGVLIVHHHYIFTDTDKLPHNSIDCGNDIYRFFKEITKNE